MPDYLAASVSEQLFLARQTITLGLLAAAVALAFAPGQPAQTSSATRDATAIVLSVMAIVVAGTEVVRWTRAAVQGIPA